MVMPVHPEILRFAPSPNGFLHLGHAFSALLNQQMAEDLGGQFLLRIEDIDLGRARSEFEAAIFDDLGWLGLSWPEPILKQRSRFDEYRAAIRELEKLGLLYPAFMTRRQIRAAVAERIGRGDDWPRDPDNAPHYPGPERDWPASKRKAEMESGRSYALRIDMARAVKGAPSLRWHETGTRATDESEALAADPLAWGDVIIARSDIPASYHLSVVVDDAFQDITRVVRGTDLQQATSIHRLLQNLLGLPEPAYFHHRLIIDGEGAKLSKRFGSRSLRDYRDAGLSPDDVMGLLKPYLENPGPGAEA